MSFWVQNQRSKAVPGALSVQIRGSVFPNREFGKNSGVGSLKTTPTPESKRCTPSRFLQRDLPHTETVPYSSPSQYGPW